MLQKILQSTLWLVVLGISLSITISNFLQYRSHDYYDFAFYVSLAISGALLVAFFKWIRSDPKKKLYMTKRLTWNLGLMFAYFATFVTIVIAVTYNLAFYVALFFYFMVPVIWVSYYLWYQKKKKD